MRTTENQECAEPMFTPLSEALGRSCLRPNFLQGTRTAVLPVVATVLKKPLRCQSIQTKTSSNTPATESGIHFRERPSRGALGVFKVTVVDKDGVGSSKVMTKADILKTAQMNPRDVRVLESQPHLHKPNILARKNCVLVRMEHVKAVRKHQASVPLNAVSR